MHYDWSTAIYLIESRGKKFRSWEEILYWLPQGSILGPLPFNIFMRDIFIIVKEIDLANYADYNTSFLFGDTLDDVLVSLENTSSKHFGWFSSNQIKANPDKSYLLISAATSSNIKIRDNEMFNSDSEKLLVVTIDSKLNVNNYLDKIFKEANQKVHVLARITQYVSISKRKLMMNSFFTSQSNYCSLVCMCHSRLMDNKSNGLHEKMPSYCLQ